jgi:hypothetical protein
MHQTEGVFRGVMEKSERVAIATASLGDPHLAACGMRKVPALGIGGDGILVPTGRYGKLQTLRTGWLRSTHAVRRQFSCNSRKQEALA